MTAVRKKTLRLGEILVRQGITTSDQINITLAEQKKNPELLGKILVRLGFVTESVIRDVIASAIGQESIHLEQVIPDSDAIGLIEEHVVRQLCVLPLTFERKTKTLTIAMIDTFNVVLIDKISTYLGSDIKIIPLLAGEAEIEKTIDLFYGFELSVDGILNEIETGEIDYQSLDTASDAYSQPVVRLVNALLIDAVKHGASDIHFEPEEVFLRFRYRIDGILRQIRSLHKSYWSAIAVRVKVMAGMDIAEIRAPQDGRISLTFLGRQIDFRVSTLPTVHGENIVLRILDRQKRIVGLEHLGIDEDPMESLRLMTARPEGIILVTGPTGSGKTTTLYSMLHYLNTESVNIMTLEDPVEYPTNLIRQTSINETVKLDFSSGIRSLMRQDPDIILVGEIRDEDTASMALRAAMTGHQVFSTLHTNSAIAAIPRLLDMGIKPDILSGNLIGVIAQRLVRKLCKQCCERYAMGSLERNLLGLKTSDKQQSIYRAKGCKTCETMGYQGRMSLIEILMFDHEMDDVLARKGSQRELLKLALDQGFKTLVDVGTKRVLDGSSSLEEITRVVDFTVRLK